MKVYQTKISQLRGTSIHEVSKKAREKYIDIKKKTKRRPYVRSAYFQKEKIFLEFFWNHLYEKLNHRDKLRRLKLFICALELIENSKFKPISKVTVDKPSEILHRFTGVTKDGELFFVQIKEERSGQKWLISAFPLEK
jgi:hypothetical protein